MLGHPRRRRRPRSGLGLLRVRVRPEMVRQGCAARADDDACRRSAATLRLPESSAGHVPPPSIDDRDSLPDDFGNALTTAYLASEGVRPEAITPLDRLAYLGSRGMGAVGVPSAARPTHTQVDSDRTVGACRSGASCALRRDQQSVRRDGSHQASDRSRHVRRWCTSQGGCHAQSRYWRGCAPVRLRPTPASNTGC